MNTLQYILDKYGFDPEQRPPMKIDGSRWRDLPELFAELGFSKGAEIGVEEGRYSKRLCEKIPGLHLTCVDLWTVYANYRDHVSQEKVDGFYEGTKKRLEPYNVKIMRTSSLDAARHTEDKSMDFVYIDANHEFLHVTQDIHAWAPKVRKGGILAGHDFARDRNRKYINHVKDVVQAWAYSHSIRPWFVMNRDKSPSWFWVVE